MVHRLLPYCRLFLLAVVVGGCGRAAAPIATATAVTTASPVLRTPAAPTMTTSPSESVRPVLGGTWVSPKVGAKVGIQKLTLSARPTVSPADVHLTKVVFKLTWGSTSARPGCTATRAAGDGTWGCTVDLAKLAVPPGDFTIGFDVFDDAGNIGSSPAGTRVATYAVPPPKPTNISFVVSQSIGTDSITNVVRITWTEPEGIATGFRLIGVSACPNESAASNHQPCLVEHTPLSANLLHTIATAGGSARSMVWTETEAFGEADGDIRGSGFFATVLEAYNRFGGSTLAIVESSEVCWTCTY